LSAKLFSEYVLPSTPFNWKSMAALPIESPTESTVTDEDITSPSLREDLRNLSTIRIEILEARL